MKAKSIIIASGALMLFLFSFPLNAQNVSGKEVFSSNCTRCHGPDGTKGKWGAKNLATSILSDSELIHIIANGKRIMPAWKEVLTYEEMRSVREYIKTLRVK